MRTQKSFAGTYLPAVLLVCFLIFVTSPSVFGVTINISPALDASAASSTGTAFAVSDGGTTIPLQEKAASSIYKRGILEFGLSQLPIGANITSAQLKLHIVTCTATGGPDWTNYPSLTLHGYAGNGVMDVSDAVVPANAIGTSSAVTIPGIKTIDLNASYIASLLGTSSYLGMLASPDPNGEKLEFLTSEAASQYWHAPELVLEYVITPEPASMLVLVTGGLLVRFGRRRNIF